jgi:hypothetical protein
MDFISILASEGAEQYPLVIPAVAFAAIAAGFFIFLGFVTYSYKNVANRHSQKWSQGNDHH